MYLTLCILFYHLISCNIINGVYEKTETVPTVKVTLEPPKLPYPSIYDLIHHFKMQNRSADKIFFDELKENYNATLNEIKNKIDLIIDETDRILDNPRFLAVAAQSAHIISEKKKEKRKHSIKDSLKSFVDRSSRILKEINSMNNNDCKNLKTSRLNMVDLISKNKKTLKTDFLTYSLIDKVSTKLLNINVPTFSVQLLYAQDVDSRVLSRIKDIINNVKEHNIIIENKAHELFKSIKENIVNNVRDSISIQLSSFNANLTNIESTVATILSHKKLSKYKPISLNLLNAHHLNVAVGAPTVKYPTPADLIDEFLKEEIERSRQKKMYAIQLIHTITNLSNDYLKNQLYLKLNKNVSLLSATSSTIINSEL